MELVTRGQELSKVVGFLADLSMRFKNDQPSMLYATKSVFYSKEGTFKTIQDVLRYLPFTEDDESYAYLERCCALWQLFSSLLGYEQVLAFVKDWHEEPCDFPDPNEFLWH